MRVFIYFLNNWPSWSIKSEKVRVRLQATIECNLRVFHLRCCLLRWLLFQSSYQRTFKEPSQIEGRKRKRIVFCKKHDKKEIEIHCKTCREDLCPLCVIKGHSGHDLDTLIDVANSCRKEIAKGAKILSERANQLNALKTEVKHTITQCEQVSKQVNIWISLFPDSQELWSDSQRNIRSNSCGTKLERRMFFKWIANRSIDQRLVLWNDITCNDSRR